MTIELINRTDEWKDGADAVALCMICGGEYSADTSVCPDCDVSLSLVRRCPYCHRLVSAHHSRCVYCRAAFTRELPINLFSAELPVKETAKILSERVRRFRAAAVSLLVFVTVFCLGLAFFRQTHKSGLPVHVIAKSYALHSTELRYAPSLGSAVVGTLSQGAAVDLTGFREKDQGRWMTLEWNNTLAYVPASKLTPPLAVDVEEGANVLKFYISGLEASGPVAAAMKAVDYYARAFPDSPHRKELRWILAKRLRALSLDGTPEGLALRRQANEQYEQLAVANGSYAAKASDATAKVPSIQGPVNSPHEPELDVDGLQIVDGAGTHSLVSASKRGEVIVLTQTEVIVRPERLFQSSEVSGRVEYNVKTNGIVAIPAGARCQLRVVSAGPSRDKVKLGLTSIEIAHRIYHVKSTSTEISALDDIGRKSSDALIFRLVAPLVVEQ